MIYIYIFLFVNSFLFILLIFGVGGPWAPLGSPRPIGIPEALWGPRGPPRDPWYPARASTGGRTDNRVYVGYVHKRWEEGISEARSLFTS